MSTDCICFNRPGWDKECPTHKSFAGYPTTDPLRNAYGEIMYWADLRLSQQHHAQQCIETHELLYKTPPDSEYSGEDLLMAACIVAKQGGFEREHEINRTKMLTRYWGDRDDPERWSPNPWDAYGRAGRGLTPR